MADVGLIERRDAPAPITLAGHTLVGRAPACAVVIEDRRVSSEHARIRWRAGTWQVRDLGSRNGTFVNGDRLDRGATRTLIRGDLVGFGDPTLAVTLIDDSPPVALARPLAGGPSVVAEDGILALFAEPESDGSGEGEPIACVFEGRDGHWVIERDGQSYRARDGEVITVAGVSYALHLPAGLPDTVDAKAGQLAIRDVALTLRVSRDEERVEVTLTGDDARVLTPRAHHYTLLTIARARVRDEDTGALPEPARGWLAVDDLCRMLATDEAHLNVEVYRIRKDVARAGVRDAAAVIERRRGSRQLRLGTSRVSIATMG